MSGIIPIYQRLTNYYRQRILNQEFQPGQAIDSITKIMIRHQVSRETAKLVLRNLIREQLIQSKAGKGSFVSFPKTASRHWGMVIPFFSPNLEQLILCVSAEADRRDRVLRHFFHYNQPAEEEKLVGSLVLEGYEAILVVPNFDESLTAQFYNRLQTGNTTLLLVDNTMSGSFFRYVVQSYDLGIKRAADYLLTRTNGNLLFVRNEIWKGRNLLDEFMQQSFAEIVTRQRPGIQVLVADGIRSLDRSFFISSRIGGVLTTTDTDAVRIIGRMKHWDISMPGDVSVINYGNTELTAYFNPAITAVDCQYETMAAKAAALIDEPAMPGEADRYVIQPQLIIRQT